MSRRRTYETPIISHSTKSDRHRLVIRGGKESERERERGRERGGGAGRRLIPSLNHSLAVSGQNENQHPPLSKYVEATASERRSSHQDHIETDCSVTFFSSFLLGLKSQTNCTNIPNSWSLLLLLFILYIHVAVLSFFLFIQRFCKSVQPESKFHVSANVRGR